MKNIFHLLNYFIQNLNLNNNEALHSSLLCCLGLLKNGFHICRMTCFWKSHIDSGIYESCVVSVSSLITHLPTYPGTYNSFLCSIGKSLSQVQVDYIYCLSLSECPVTPLWKEIKSAWHSLSLSKQRSWLYSPAVSSLRWLQID